jgi:polyhydroxybutyrate depolymerase
MEARAYSKRPMKLQGEGRNPPPTAYEGEIYRLARRDPMKRLSGYGALASIVLLLGAPGGARGEATGETLSLVHGGATRSYILHVPPGARGRPAPLIVVLHGGGGRAAQMSGFTGFDAIAAREGFVTLYPQGLNRSWNDGREFPGRNTGTDDVGFILAAIEDAKRRGALIDERRIFAAGISNGGFMAQRLACEASRVFAAVASVTATMPAATGERCRPDRPVSVLLLNGTADPLVPYEGGHVTGPFGMKTRGAIWSTDASMAFWARHNRCGGGVRHESLPDRDPGDRTRILRIEHVGCRGAEVALLRVEGGGHTWPGRVQYLPASLIGPVNRDIDGSEAIWAFFKSAARR